jgi:cobalamin biosynthesis protein CobC
MRGQLKREAALLDGVLARASLAVVGGTDLYRLARHPDATPLHGRLAGARIWVRRFDRDPTLLRFGLPPGEAARHRLAHALS